MFVLKPLMDICPQWNHPILDVNIKKIISSSESLEKIRIYRNIL
jgi:7,8-dihydro-6-hydroxymethylpterin-pyrophosphokinase